MKSDPAVIEVSALRVEREAVILESIDWRVERGEHWAILGANGSGKTSLLRALTGYLPPTAGRNSRARRDLRALRLARSEDPDRAGQFKRASDDGRHGETALKAVVSGRYAQIGYWGEMRPDDRRAATAILRRIEASQLRDRPWRFLSQGERQRVLIGRALMASPRLMILDEPCAGLDPVAREHFLQFLRRLARTRGAPTMVLVTHHVEEIVPLFSHVLVLKSGRVLAAGPRGRVLTSSALSSAFQAPVRLTRERGRYSLSVRPHRAIVI